MAWLIVVVGAMVFAADVKLPAMNTRAALPVPTTSMSQISPLLIRGVLVLGLSGTSRVCPREVGGGSVTVTLWVVAVDARPWLSVTTREIVFEPAVV